MKTIDRPRSAWIRRSRLRMAAWADWSSDDVGSSATSTWGSGRERPCDRHPLPLAARQRAQARRRLALGDAHRLEQVERLLARVSSGALAATAGPPRRRRRAAAGGGPASRTGPGRSSGPSIDWPARSRSPCGPAVRPATRSPSMRIVPWDGATRPDDGLGHGRLAAAALADDAGRLRPAATRRSKPRTASTSSPGRLVRHVEAVDLDEVAGGSHGCRPQVTSSARMQAVRCVDHDAGRGWSPVLQTSSARCAQRGQKRQPSGHDADDGRSHRGWRPGPCPAPPCPGGSGAGRACMGVAAGHGCRPTRPSSTVAPAYIVMTRCAQELDDGEVMGHEDQAHPEVLAAAVGGASGSRTGR